MNHDLIMIAVFLSMVWAALRAISPLDSPKQKHVEEPMTPLGDLFEDGDRERGTPHVKGGRQPSKTPHTKFMPAYIPRTVHGNYPSFNPKPPTSIGTIRKSSPLPREIPSDTSNRKPFDYSEPYVK